MEKKKKVPRGIRNKNPGNLEYSEANPWQGQVGIEEMPEGGRPRFAVFDTMESGVRAATKVVRNKISGEAPSTEKTGPQNTLPALISSYAPSVENDVPAYVRSVAKGADLDPNMPLDPNDPDMMRRVMKAMGRHETGVELLPQDLQGVDRVFQETPRVPNPAQFNKKAPRPGLKEYINQGFSSLSNFLVSPVMADEIPVRQEAIEGQAQPMVSGPVMVATNAAEQAKNQRRQAFQLMKNNPQVVSQMIENTELDDDTREQAHAILATPEAIDEIQQNAEQERDQPSLSAQFIEGIAFFLPQLLGAGIGYAMEGAEGAVEGADRAQKNQEAWLKYQQNKEEMAIKRQQKKSTSFQQSQYTDENGQPLIFDPGTGFYRSMTGAIVNPGKVKSRQEEGLNLQKERLGIQQEKATTDRYTRVVQDFNRSEIIKGAKQSIAFAQKARKNIELNNPITPNVVIRAIARISGEKGVMTEKDVESFRGSPRWTDKAEQLFQEAIKGGFTETNKKYLLEILANMETVERELMDTEASNYAEQHSGNVGMDKKTFKSKLLGEVKKSLMTDEQRQELEALRAKYRK